MLVLTFAPCTCCVILLSTSASTPPAHMVVVTGCNLRWWCFSFSHSAGHKETCSTSIALRIRRCVADVRSVPITHDAHRLARQRPPMILAVRHHRLVVRILVNSRISLLATSRTTGGICGTGLSSVATALNCSTSCGVVNRTYTSTLTMRVTAGYSRFTPRHSFLVSYMMRHHRSIGFLCWWLRHFEGAWYEGHAFCGATGIPYTHRL